MFRSMWAVSWFLAGVAAAGMVDDPVWVREAVRESTREVWEKENGNYAEPALYRRRATYWEVAGDARAEESPMDASMPSDVPDSKRRLVKARCIVGASGQQRRPLYAGLFTYSFLGVEHCNQCFSVGKVSVLTWRDGRWVANAEMLGGANASVRSARFLDVTEDDEPELLVEVDEGVNAWYSCGLYVFDVTGGQLRQRAMVDTRADGTHSGFEHERYDKQLDLAKTRATGGHELVFRVTTWWRKGVRLPAPEVTEERVAVKAGAGRR